MADSMISALADSGALQATDQFVVARAGADKSVLAQRVMRTVGSSPPSSPVDGDIWVLPVDATNGVYWEFMYVSSQTTYKWVFVGGANLAAGGAGPNTVINANTQVGTSGYYYHAATMSVIVPRAGDYDVAGFSTLNDSSARFLETQIFTDAPAVFARSQSGLWVSGVNTVTQISTGTRLTGVASGARVGICVTSGAVGTTKIFSDQQFVRVTPVRVS